MRANTLEKLKISFWQFVIKSDDCWLWNGSISKSGYGYIGMNNKDIGAHVVAYQLQYDNYDPKLFVLHRCDNPLCVKGSHLFQGTQCTNMNDMYNKKRNRNGSKGLAKIQFADVKARYAKGETLTSIANDYNVAQSYIGNIVYNKVLPNDREIKDYIELRKNG